MKLVFLNLWKKGESESLAEKTTYFTHKISYLNPKEEEDSSYKIGIFIGNCFKLKMGLAGSFLSHSPRTFKY